MHDTAHCQVLLSVLLPYTPTASPCDYGLSLRDTEASCHPVPHSLESVHGLVLYRAMFAFRLVLVPYLTAVCTLQKPGASDCSLPDC